MIYKIIKEKKIQENLIVVINNVLYHYGKIKKNS